MRHEFEHVPRFFLTSSVDYADVYFTVVSSDVPPIVLEDKPGIAVINPSNGDAREMIAFGGVTYFDGEPTLFDVQRGIHGTQPMVHPNGTEVYFDQGQKYNRLASNNPKSILKRSLRRLLG